LITFASIVASNPVTSANAPSANRRRPAAFAFGLSAFSAT
jgi:hypothetical protein